MSGGGVGFLSGLVGNRGGGYLGAMIDVAGLTKRYGAHTAVRDLSFRVGKGQIVGFLGPNGAGKSTTMRVLAGFLGMTAGTVKVAGFDVAEESDEARRHVGYMPEAVPLYPEMRVLEYLKFRAELKQVARRDRLRFVDEAMQKARVTDVANVTIGNLSKGYRQRVGLADALVAKPPLLILDEPTAGLDPNQIREVREVLRHLGEEHTVLLSTHILSEVEATCSRAIVIDRGRLIAQGALEEIRAKGAPSMLLVTVRGDGAAARRALERVTSVSKVTSRGDGAMQTFEVKWKGATATELAEHLARAVVETEGLGLVELRPAATSLEEVFARLTGDAEAAEAEEEAAS